jgi:hypothetical protein
VAAFYVTDSEQKTNVLGCFAMARRPDFGNSGDMMSRKDLDALAESLAHLSRSAVLDFYQSAYRDCRIINSSTFPSARAVQQLVQAWKQLRKWRK